MSACPKCGYPPAYVHPPENRVRMKPRAELDAETIAILDSAKRTAAEVRTWPSWRAGFCTCATRRP